MNGAPELRHAVSASRWKPAGSMTVGLFMVPSLVRSIGQTTTVLENRRRHTDFLRRLCSLPDRLQLRPAVVF